MSEEDIAALAGLIAGYRLEDATDSDRDLARFVLQGWHLTSAHTARLAALDAEIAEAAQALAILPLGMVVGSEMAGRLSGLRRAREIIAGKGKP